MLALKRLRPAGMGPERLFPATSTNLNSGWEKSGSGPSNLLCASDSSSSLGDVMELGTGPEKSLEVR
jgi:hypothetical protein